ncbi:MAG: hypothetical protein GF349_04270 [Candidatus Magasanikbacteria bacterium]|nr:hypothetical protein [Candidatus Magasanikbacteria bacterium]
MREELQKKLDEALRAFSQEHDLPHLNGPFDDLTHQLSDFEFDEPALSHEQLAAAG